MSNDRHHYDPKLGEPVSDSGLARATYRMQVEALAMAIAGDPEMWRVMTEPARETYRQLARGIGRGEDVYG